MKVPRACTWSSVAAVQDSSAAACTSACRAWALLARVRPSITGLSPAATSPCAVAALLPFSFRPSAPGIHAVRGCIRPSVATSRSVHAVPL